MKLNNMLTFNSKIRDFKYSVTVLVLATCFVEYIDNIKIIYANLLAT